MVTVPHRKMIKKISFQDFNKAFVLKISGFQYCNLGVEKLDYLIQIVSFIL